MTRRHVLHVCVSIAVLFCPLVACAQGVLTPTTLQSGDGSAAAPAQSFLADTDTGLYRIGTNNLGISTGGTLRTDFNSTRALFAVPLYAPDGTAGAPSVTFGADTDNGLYRIGTNNIGLSAGGTLRADWNTTRMSSALTIQPATTNTYDLGASGTIWGAVYQHYAQIGSDATAANNVRVRGGPEFDGNGMLAVTIGDGSDFGDLRLRRIASGAGGGDQTFATYNGAYWNAFNTYTAGAPGTELDFYKVGGTTTPSAGITVPAIGFQADLNTDGTFNYSGAYQTAMYGGMYSAGSGTHTDVVGVLGDVEHGSTGAATSVFSFMGFCCSYDGASPNGAIATSGFFHATKPFRGTTQSTNHKAIWIEDQTTDGVTAFTPSGFNHVIHYDAPAGTYYINAADARVKQTDVQLIPNGVSKPTCNSTNRGTFWYTAGAGGVKDNVEVCAKDAADAYAYRTIY